MGDDYLMHCCAFVLSFVIVDLSLVLIKSSADAKIQQLQLLLISQRCRCIQQTAMCADIILVASKPSLLWLVLSAQPFPQLIHKTNQELHSSIFPVLTHYTLRPNISQHITCYVNVQDATSSRAAWKFQWMICACCALFGCHLSSHFQPAAAW